MSNKFHWTKEEYGYVLRDSNGYARSAITVRNTNRHQFYGVLFMRNLPKSGPYKSRKEAAEWVTSMAVRFGHLPSDSTFEDITKDDLKVLKRRSLEEMG